MSRRLIELMIPDDLNWRLVLRLYYNIPSWHQSFRKNGILKFDVHFRFVDVHGVLILGVRDNGLEIRNNHLITFFSIINHKQTLTVL